MDPQVVAARVPSWHEPEPRRKFVVRDIGWMPSNDRFWMTCEWEQLLPGSSCWTVPYMAAAKYTVLMGYHGSKKRTIHGKIQEQHFAWPPSFRWSREHRIDVDHPGGEFSIEGPCVQRLTFVHFWLQGMDGIPSVRSHEEDTTTLVPVCFDPQARGCVGDWNASEDAPRGSSEAQVFWGMKARKVFWNLPSHTRPDINNLLAFLRAREQENGDHMLRLLHPPVRQRRGWFSLSLRRLTQQRHEELRRAGWVRAWHGCKLEAVYSILYHGRLFASRDDIDGERCFRGASGVYVFNDEHADKAENYVRWVHLHDDGVFWAAKWELRVDREQKVHLKHKDQWCQNEAGVQLAALWLCGRAASDMEEGTPVSRAWRPELEANPRSFRNDSMTRRRDSC